MVDTCTRSTTPYPLLIKEGNPKALSPSGDERKEHSVRDLSRITQCSSFPRKRESSLSGSDVDPRLRGGDNNSHLRFHIGRSVSLRRLFALRDSLRTTAA